MPAPSIAPLFLSLALVGDGGGSLRGVVVDPEGRPAPGAEVVAVIDAPEGEPPVVIGRALADAGGRFAIDRPGGPSVRAGGTLWATRPGSVAGSRPILRGVAGEAGVRLALGRSPGARLLVLDPGGRPVSGAVIVPRRVAREAPEVPEAVGRLASATTGPDGRAALAAFRPEELLEVGVEAPGYGLQVREFGAPGGLADAGPRTLALRPVGRVAGRAVAEDGRGVGGLKVRVGSAVGPRGSADSASAEVVTDPSGRFEVVAIAAGSIAVRAVTGEGGADLPARVVRRALEPGGSVEVEIPLRRGVRVVGRVVDDRDGSPVPDAVVAITPPGPLGPIRATSDALGRYEAFAPSGLVGRRALAAPDPYLVPPAFVGRRPAEVPPGIARFELPELRLARGSDLRGRVVDRAGVGVAGATVEARWTWLDGRARAVRTASTTSGEGGSFEVGPVAPDAEVVVSASSGSGVAEAIPAPAGANRPLLLTLAGGDAAPPSGRVVGADGRGIAGALVRLWRVGGGGPAALEEAGDLTTDLEGRYRAPRPPGPGRDLLAFASVDGRGVGRTPPLGVGSSTFADLVLQVEPDRMAAEGRVVDSRGRPVAGAEVRASGSGGERARATTDAGGRFRLDGLPRTRAFLFAEAAGFRFLGRAIDPARGPYELALTRLDEAPPSTMKALPGEPADRNLAARVLAPYAERVLSGGDHASRFRTLDLLCRVDPDRILALVGANGVDDPALADHLRRVASGHLADPDPVARLALVRSIRDAEGRALAAMEAADASPTTARALRREWLELALDATRAIDDPGSRVAALAGVADRLARLGEARRADRLLLEAAPAAEALPTGASGARARVAFAEALARVDPGRALAMAGTMLDPAAFDRARLRIARRLAPVNPAGIAAVLDAIHDPRALGADLPGICRALAGVDPAQALGLIDRARPDDPTRPASALGMMAGAVAEVDKPEATRWLRLAFDRLGRVAGRGSPRDPACVAAALLPVAERVDPSLVPELFWRAVSFHEPRQDQGGRTEALLALLLARYDREVALDFFEPAASLALADPRGDLAPILAAAALLDPRMAVRLVNSLPEAPDLTFHHPRNQARLSLAEALGRGAPACWDHATAPLLGLRPDASPDLD